MDALCAGVRWLDLRDKWRNLSCSRCVVWNSFLLCDPSQETVFLEKVCQSLRDSCTAQFPGKVKSGWNYIFGHRSDPIRIEPMSNAEAYRTHTIYPALGMHSEQTHQIHGTSVSCVSEKKHVQHWQKDCKERERKSEIRITWIYTSFSLLAAIHHFSLTFPGWNPVFNKEINKPGLYDLYRS